MKIYMVYEEDRGMGEMEIAAYYNKVSAEEHAKQSSHYFILESDILDNPLKSKDVVSHSTSDNSKMDAIALLIKDISNWEEEDCNHIWIVREIKERLEKIAQRHHYANVVGNSILKTIDCRREK